MTERFAELALTEGVDRRDATGNFRRFLDRYWYSPGITDVKVYHEKIYLFGRDKCLVTILNLPANLRKIANKIQVRKRRTNDESS